MQRKPTVLALTRVLSVLLYVRAVVRNLMENMKPHMGKTQMTQTAAKDLRNKHTIGPLPFHRHGEQSLQVLFADAPVQCLTCLKDFAKMGLKRKPPDPQLLD